MSEAEGAPLPGRRLLLQRAAAATAGAALAGCRPAGSTAEPPGPTLEIPGAGELIPANMPRAFSPAEIERRWARVRERMAAAGFDCLIVPQRPEGNADVKYLTESLANWVVFPLDGPVSSVFRRRREADEAKARIDIPVRMHVSLLDRSQVLIEALNELGLERGRIGVGNLSGTLRQDEGGVSFTTLDNLRRALPGARFESASDLLMRVKLVRGPEEIEVLRWVSRVSELAIRAIVESTGVGVMHGEVWFRVFRELFDASGEMPPRVTMRGGEEAGTGGGVPLTERFEPGQILNQAVSGSVQGYLSQVNHSICVGPPAPPDWESACGYCIDLFHRLVDWIEPGRSFQEFGDFYRREVEKRGEFVDGVVFHTAGPEGDGPRMGPTRPDETQDLVLQAGMVFTIKPRVPVKGVPAPAVQVGDPVLVTQRGGERLGRRPLEVITLGR